MNLRRIYEYRFRDVDEDARAAVWREVAGFLYARFERPERVLDPAAGLGEFIAGCPAPDRWAVDVVDYGISDFDGVTSRIAPILDADLPEHYFDLVFASNLLEHLATPEQIADVLARFHDLVRPGGRVAIMGPNFRYCAREYFDCADHVLALTHVTVAEHLYGAGFEVTDLVPRFLPYSFRSSLPASPRLARWYLHAPPLWRVLGKQFLVVGRAAPA